MPDFALIDADIVAYRAASANQKDLDWDDGEGEVRHVSAEDATAAAIQTVHQWTELAGCRRPIICLSSPVNFRKHVWPAYKANRATVERPEALEHVKAELAKAFKSFMLHGLEADDVMGILATSGRYSDCVIVSLDKDMQTVPAFVFRPGITHRPRRIREPTADRWWMTQTLMGDATDGYPGCPGIGPKKAEAILEKCSLELPDMWGAVRGAFEAKGLSETDALTMARLSRILRRSDYDREKQEISLWHPTRPVPLSAGSLGANPPPPLATADPTPCSMPDTVSSPRRTSSAARRTPPPRTTTRDGRSSPSRSSRRTASTS